MLPLPSTGDEGTAGILPCAVSGAWLVLTRWPVHEWAQILPSMTSEQMLGQSSLQPQTPGVDTGRSWGSAVVFSHLLPPPRRVCRAHVCSLRALEMSASSGE